MKSGEALAQKCLMDNCPHVAENRAVAYRLDDLVICGEINNTIANSVHGWLGLRNCDHPVPLHLTGNCDADLQGKHIRFQIRESQLRDDPLPDLPPLANQQIGPTGTMTTARKVKDFDTSPQEFYARAKLGEPPPFTWKQCLYLEWFSQNGRVVLELVDPLIEFVEPGEEDAAEPYDAQSGQRNKDADGLPEATDASSERDDGLFDDGLFDDGLFDDGLFDDDDDDENEDPFGLFPTDLAEQLQADSLDIDRQLFDREDDDDAVRDLELMDSLLESGEDVPVGSLFEPPIKLPPADGLNDRQVEGALKTLLARMAQYGIALDMCEHYTPRDAYVLLVERICREEGAFPELCDTQWVQHFMTHDFCQACQAEFEEESQNGENDDPPETDT